MKYRKKPIVVEATQWFKDGDHNEVKQSSNPDFYSKVCSICNSVFKNHGWIDMLKGGHIVCPSDWIITGIKGEHYPIKDDIFKATYARVREPAKGGGQAEASKDRVGDFSLPEPNDEFVSIFSDSLFGIVGLPPSDVHRQDRILKESWDSNKPRSKSQAKRLKVQKADRSAMDDVFDIANKEPLITQDDLDTLLTSNRTDAEREKITKDMDKIFAEARDCVDKLSVGFESEIDLDISICYKCGKKLEVFTSCEGSTHTYIACGCKREIDISGSECKICKGSKLVCNLCGVGVVDSKSVAHLCKSKDMLLTRHAVQCPECLDSPKTFIDSVNLEELSECASQTCEREDVSLTSKTRILKIRITKDVGTYGLKKGDEYEATLSATYENRWQIHPKNWNYLTIHLGVCLDEDYYEICKGEF